MKQWKAFVLTACMVTSIALVAGCNQGQEAQQASQMAATAAKEALANKQETIDLTYYVPLDTGTGLGPKEMKVENTEAGMKKAVETVILEDSKQKYPLFPNNLKVLDVKVKNNIATVNLSKEFMEGERGGIMMSRMEIGAIGNTVCNFPGVKKVKFAVEGKKLDLFGGMDLGEPIGADKTLIAK